MRPRLWQLVLAFQIPTLLVAALMCGLELADRGRVEGAWAALFAVPMSVALLLGAAVTWAIERWRPLPRPSLPRTTLRYLVPAFGLLHLIVLGFSFLVGAFWHSAIDWGVVASAYGILIGAALVLAALPLFGVALVAHRAALRRRAG